MSSLPSVPTWRHLQRRWVGLILAWWVFLWLNVVFTRSWLRGAFIAGMLGHSVYHWRVCKRRAEAEP